MLFDECSRASYVFCEEVTNVDSAFLATKESIWDASAFHVLAPVFCHISSLCVLQARGAAIQSTVEGLFAVYPELEVASGVVGIAREGDLGDSRIDLVENGFVGNIAHLEVLVNDDTLLIADCAFSSRQHGLAGIVGGTDITVDSVPAVFTVASITLSG